MKQADGFYKYWSFLIIYTLFIFFISTFPGNYFQKAPRFIFLDKIAHIFIYSVLGLISLRAFRGEKGITGRNLLFCLIYCMLVGVFDEAYQSLVPERTVDFFDLLSDFSGALIGSLIYYKSVTF
ncbi:MAG: VanZ family protein [Candidatus Omnitrophica bacterium]|nr:VanZ family protein [Candidatus Omnitrophota bacterium]